MLRKITFLAAQIGAAYLLCSTASAQVWSARWHPTSSYDDEGQVVAVGRSGATYVAGKSKTPRSGANWDFVVLKYDASGTKLWERTYNGIGNGDDIPTSIAVDYDENIYIGGVSWGGDPDLGGSAWDFAVLKLEPINGNTVWPNDETHTGYRFWLGAVRTTSTLNEGAQGVDGVAINVNAPMAIRQDWSGENRIIATAGRGASTVGLLVHKLWRVVVFEPSGSSVQIKSGWPVNYTKGEGDYEFNEVKVNAIAIQMRLVDKQAHPRPRADLSNAWSIKCELLRNKGERATLNA